MKIGFIGLGIMGEAMCRNIVKKHDDAVYCFDLDPEKVALLVKDGAIAGDSNSDVAKKADVIITMVPKAIHSWAVYREILPALGAGKTCIDMSTIEPGESIKIAEMVEETGAVMIDAPVVKSRPAAEAGKLGIYVGGEKAVFEKMKPILSYMGENLIYMGGHGNGLVMKICHNGLVAQIQNGVNEMAALADANGIDVLTFAEAISYGGGQNFYLDSKKQAIHDRNFKTAFSVENMDKDVHICLKLAESKDVEVPGEENAAAVYETAMAKGFAKEDFSATYKIWDPEE